MDKTSLRQANRYDPDESYAKADRLTEFYNQSEALQWWQHPCTKELILRLEGDMAAASLSFLDGVTIDYECADRTAQMTARVNGNVQAIDDVLHLIELIKKKESYVKEDQDSGLHGTDQAQED